ncbi:MAG: alpha/beta hydrolase-fold protein [Gemmatimonadota bacterium]|nr:alpha/beta hydrolase-fold protein [Gemmatimonadota bacterium]
MYHYALRLFWLTLSAWVLIPDQSVAQLEKTDLKFEISFPTAISSKPLTGRMFIVITRDGSKEPRLQVGRYAPLLLGVDIEQVAPGNTVTIDGNTLGWPIESLRDLPKGEYYVQAVLNKYTKFERSDGHILWMHNDQWEGQHWNRSPGNVASSVQKVMLDPAMGKNHRFEVTDVIPPIEVPGDTEWVKRIKIQSKILTEFWGQPIYLGATLLLPRGYDQHPDTYYPAVYAQGHFSLGAPLRFGRNQTFSDTWKSSETYPRFVAVTLQHPTPYFDDSYAVNSANNGPYGDAIHQELIPEIEKRFRVIPEPYGRVLTGGSTGGWESFALQVFYPDFYGGTWSFAPDPIDFRNVEGINVYEDTNAFYKIHEWYKAPIANTRFAPTGEVRLTSKQRNMMELVHGSKGRSGQQLDIWSSVFGPVGEDGYFKPLFDKHTGTMDPTVAQYWKENYDLRYYLEKNWAEVGPSLVGKLHVICGHMDNFYLNVGVYHMEAFLESTREPYYAGSITYGARGSHGYRPYSTEQLLRIMADHITKNAPPGADTGQWKY